MTFFDLLFYSQRGVHKYLHLRAACKQSYLAVTSWLATSDAQIDTLIASRQIWRANYVARFELEFARRFNDQRARGLRGFRETGALLP